eukprot:12076807-Heterocapsa_arctica.AAC.1
MRMDFAYFATVVRKADCNTSGGNLRRIKEQMNSEPQCLWTTGVITKEYTALPDTEFMKAEDLCLDRTEKADKVYRRFSHKDRGQCIRWMGNV